MPADDTRKLRILVAEDEPLAALVLQEALAAEGHRILLAEDGAVALTLAESEPFDVLVTDLAMPRLGGLGLIRHLRAERPDLPVVVMTGHLDAATAAELQSQPAPLAGLLHKPFSAEALLMALAGIGQPAAAG
jgi:CheY-like chemotaxis protein